MDHIYVRWIDRGCQHPHVDVGSFHSRKLQVLQSKHKVTGRNYQEPRLSVFCSNYLPKVGQQHVSIAMRAQESGSEGKEVLRGPAECGLTPTAVAHSWGPLSATAQSGREALVSLSWPGLMLPRACSVLRITQCAHYSYSRG